MTKNNRPRLDSGKRKICVNAAVSTVVTALIVAGTLLSGTINEYSPPSTYLIVGAVGAAIVVRTATKAYFALKEYGSDKGEHRATPLSGEDGEPTSSPEKDSSTSLKEQP